MATVFDLSLLQPFDILFAAILVFAFMFALLRKTKATGTDNISIDAIISVSVAFLVILSDVAVEIINFMIPWFVVVFLFIMLLLLIYQVFGVGEKDIAQYLRNDKGLGWLLMAVGLVIFLAALGNSLGQETLDLTQGTAASVTTTTAVGGGSVGSGNFEANVFSTLFHPKVLGIGVVMLIMIFAIALLTGPAKP